MTHRFTLSGTVASLLLATVQLANAQPEKRSHVAAEARESLALPSGARYPNGIARASDGTLYVGLITEGRILRKRPGEGWTTFFAGTEALYASTSLRLDEPRGLLWGTSPDYLPADQVRPHRVFALDIRTGAVRRIFTLPEGGTGNDTALTPDGTVYLTDSGLGGVLRLRPDDAEFQVVLRDERLGPVGGVGSAGIARAADGTLVIGNFGTGKIYVLSGADDDAPRLREIALPRTIENPDGMGLAPNGSLIVLEGAIQSGVGRVLRIADPFVAGPRTIEVIRDDLESPVNLTIAPDGRAFVSESRIRHRLHPGRERDVPDRFRIVEIDLAAVLNDK